MKAIYRLIVLAGGQALDPVASRPRGSVSTAITSCLSNSVPTAVMEDVVALLQVEFMSNAQELTEKAGGLWTFVICFGVAFLVAMACTFCCTRIMMSRQKADPWDEKGRAAKFDRNLETGRLMTGPGSMAGSMTSTQSSLPSQSYGGNPISAVAKMPLCPKLLVPSGTRLACIVQNSVCRKRQELAFNVHGMQSRGCVALFQLRVSECTSQVPGVYAETLWGKEQLAFLSTEDLWRNVSRPKLVITKPWGETYGIMQSDTTDKYTLSCLDAFSWTFSGDFRGHSIQVTDSAGEVVGNAWPETEEEYTVFVQGNADAGLLLLGLMAIDKCEIEPKR